MDAAALAQALAELPEPAGDLARKAVDDELTLWLPSVADGPLASPELIRPSRAAGHENGAGTGSPAGAVAQTPTEAVAGAETGAVARNQAGAVAQTRTGGVAGAESGAGSQAGGVARGQAGGVARGRSGGDAGGQPGRRRVSLAAWRVPALAFDAVAAVELLAALGEPGMFSGEAMAGGTARYLAAVARLAADLPARGRVLPSLRSEDGPHAARWPPVLTGASAEDGGYAARWRPVLTGADAERARELAAGMPAMCRATSADGESSAAVFTEALDALADAAARAWLAPQPLLPARRGRRPARIPVAERWVAALTAASPQVEVTSAEDEHEAAQLAAQLDAWHAAAQLPPPGPHLLPPGRTGAARAGAAGAGAARG